jgi:MFS transporter, DHA1 family, inner membrane transport protein
MGTAARTTDAEPPSVSRDAPTAKLGALLFLCLFANQAGVSVLSPILVSIARDFDVPITTAGQLRTVSGVVAGLTALCVGWVGSRIGLRTVLRCGLLLLMAGSLASATSGSFDLLLASQVPVGVGIALVLSAGVAGSAEWVPAAKRSHVLSWTLIGQPAVWVIGMPIIGLVAQASWRWAWIAVPFVASAVACYAVAKLAPQTPPREPTGGMVSLLRVAGIRAWAIGELLAFTGWAGALVYVGALLQESYDTSVGTTGLVLGAAALAYIPGSLLARRWVDRWARRVHVALSLAGGLCVALLGLLRPSLSVSAGLFAAFVFVNGGRTIAGSSLGFQVASAQRVAAMGLRAAATQFGYLFGAAIGGIALSLGGYACLGVGFGLILALGVVPHLSGRVTVQAGSR